MSQISKFRKRARIAMLIAAGISVSAATTGTRSDVVISFGNLSSQSGTIYVSLCDEAGYEQMARSGCRRSFSMPAREGARMRFKNVPAGRWAAVSYHDENGNGKLDTNYFGIPTEATGTSRNAVGRFGPPSFDQAAFRLGAENVSLAIDFRKVSAR